MTLPDPNKFEKLRDIEYRIPVTCGVCVHANLKPGADWGTCSIHKYSHQKHSGSDREVSIFRGGACAFGKFSEGDLVKLGAHREFTTEHD